MKGGGDFAAHLRAPRRRSLPPRKLVRPPATPEAYDDDDSDPLRVRPASHDKSLSDELRSEDDERPVPLDPKEEP